MIVVLLDKNYIVSVVITFFYTILNYLLTNNDAFLTQPFGLNAGTLLPGPLAFRWTFQFYDHSSISEELAELLERISPYFLNNVQVFGVAFAEAAVFLALIAMVLPASRDLRGCDYVELIKIGITETTPVPDPLGRTGGACTLSVGSIWKPVDCRAGVPESQL